MVFDDIQVSIDAAKPESIQQAQNYIPVFEELEAQRRIAFTQYRKAAIYLTGETEIDAKVRDTFGDDWGRYRCALEAERGETTLRAEWNAWQEAENKIGIFWNRIGPVISLALKTRQKQTSSKTEIIPAIPPQTSTKISFRGNLKELAAFILDLESTGKIEHPTDKQIASHFTYNGNKINIDSLKSIRSRDL